MEESEIEKLFLSAAEDLAQDTDAARQVFSILIRTTLKFRDDVLASRDMVVTVEDVRTSLGWLVPALATGNIPAIDNKVSLGLLKMWLSELKCI